MLFLISISQFGETHSLVLLLLRYVADSKDILVQLLDGSSLGTHSSPCDVLRIYRRYAWQATRNFIFVAPIPLLFLCYVRLSNLTRGGIQCFLDGLFCG